MDSHQKCPFPNHFANIEKCENSALSERILLFFVDRNKVLKSLKNAVTPSINSEFTKRRSFSGHCATASHINLVFLIKPELTAFDNVHMYSADLTKPEQGNDTSVKVLEKYNVVVFFNNAGYGMKLLF